MTELRTRLETKNLRESVVEASGRRSCQRLTHQYKREEITHLWLPSPDVKSAKS